MARALVTATPARCRRRPPGRPPAARRSGRPAPPGLPAGPGTPRQNSSSASRRAPGCFPPRSLGAPSSRRIARQETAPRPSACRADSAGGSRGRPRRGAAPWLSACQGPALLAGCVGAGQPTAWPGGRRPRRGPALAGRLRQRVRGHRSSGNSAAARRELRPAPLAGCAAPGQPPRSSGKQRRGPALAGRLCWRAAWTSLVGEQRSSLPRARAGSVGAGAASGSRWPGLAGRCGGRAPPPRLVAVPGRLRPSGASLPGRHGLAVGGVIRRANTVILNPGES
jgi:hypothetical protein